MAGDTLTKPDRSGHSEAIDLHIGSRLYAQRKILGMTQNTLADALGVKIQTIQTYENGLHRIIASHLFELSRLLMVPISYFFDESRERLDTAAVHGGPVYTKAFIENLKPLKEIGYESLHTRESYNLARSFYRIKDPAVRKRMVDLIKSLAVADDPNTDGEIASREGEQVDQRGTGIDGLSS